MLMQTLSDLDPPNRVHHLTLNLAYRTCLSKMKVGFNLFLNNFLSGTITAYGHHITRVEILKVSAVTLVYAFCSLLAKCLKL